QLLDRAHPQLETAGEILAVERELPLDVAEQRRIFLHQREALAGDHGIAGGQRLADAERVGELQPEARRRIDRLAQELLERFELARRPCRWIALLGAQRLPRADRQHILLVAEQIARRVL